MSERDVFQGIRKPHVLEAILRTTQEGYPPSRISTTYDLVYKGISYPPKYILALAGYFYNKKFIVDKFEGGEGTACFEHLRGLGFEILPKGQTKSYTPAKQNADVQDKYIANAPPMNAPEFFTQQDIDALARFAGQGLNETVPGMTDTYHHLKATYLKVEYWAQEVLKKTFPEGKYTIRKRPTNQANKFEQYQWAKLYPDEDTYEFQHLAYTLTFSNYEYLCVKIDNVALKDTDPLRKKYFEYRGDFFNSPIVKIFQPNEILGTSWEVLISKSVEVIKGLTDHYQKLLNIMGYNEESIGNTQDVKENYERLTRMSLNTILYGPPGTGKTHELNSIKVRDFTDTGIKKSKEEQLHEALVEYPFWQVLAAVLNTSSKPLSVSELVEHPIVKFRVKPGIKTKPQNLAWADLQSYADDESSQLVAKYRRSIKLFHKEGSKWSIAKDKINSLPEIIDQRLIDLAKAPTIPVTLTNAEVKRYNFITFHQKYSYEDFIEGIKPVLQNKQEDALELDTETPGQLAFELKKGIFFESCLKALNLAGYNSFKECYADTRQNRKMKFEEAKSFALFIDEVNRANVSAVFGELITLIEENKRIGSDEEMWVRLPLSHESFAVPPNLYIIGSMNTADKSIALIDIALRRRFEFEGRYPNYSPLDNDRRELLKQINAYIFEKKGSADYLIGHAYFLGAKPIDIVLKNKVIPLLMEYFMGKIGMVEEAFKKTGWTVKYNPSSYSWDITR